MPITLTKHARERSTYVVDVSFFDENNAAVIPTAIYWTLTDGNAIVVNSRLVVSVTPAASVSILLSGADLAIGYGLLEKTRKLLIEATYNSTLGSGLPLKEEITFEIDDFAYPIGVS